MEQATQIHNNIEEMDSRGRTRRDVEIESKSLKQSVLDSIRLVNGKWLIEEKDADEWIELDREVHENKGPYVKGQG